MPYNNNSDYLKYQVKSSVGDSSSTDCGCDSSNSECSCCPTGTVAVYNDDGSHSGCLTPNDAEIYNNSKIVPPEGYVKTFHPATGAYLGAMSVADSIELLNYLSNNVVSTANSDNFNIVLPEVLPSGFVDITYPLSDGITGDIELSIDRLGTVEGVVLSIVNTTEDIQFVPSGTTSIIPVGDSNKTVKFKWTGIAAVGTYMFTLNFGASGVSKDIVFRLTLT